MENTEAFLNEYGNLDGTNALSSPTTKDEINYLVNQHLEVIAIEERKFLEENSHLRFIG